MLEFLPESIKNALKYVNSKYLYELRLRVNKPVMVNYEGNYTYLGEYGLTDSPQKAIRVTAEEIEAIVYVAGKFSVYSVEEQIKRGFLTAEGGERIGLAGEFVFEKGQALAAKNFTSLCIRVPHEIIGAGQEVYEKCFHGGLKSALIASPPGQGKTTILRDLCRLISQKTRKNVLICDERGEISSGEIGDTTDVYTFADKQTAFEAGIRAMRPDVLVCDELSAFDLIAVKRAIDGGVKVVASAHIRSKEYLSTEAKELFERFVFLSEKTIGKVDKIYDEKLCEIG